VTGVEGGDGGLSRRGSAVGRSWRENRRRRRRRGERGRGLLDDDGESSPHRKEVVFVG